MQTAVHHRHHHIQQQHIRLFGFPHFDAFHTVFRFDHRIALALQIQAQQFADICFVFDDEYLFRHSFPLLSHQYVFIILLFRAECINNL